MRPISNYISIYIVFYLSISLSILSSIYLYSLLSIYIVFYLLSIYIYNTYNPLSRAILDFSLLFLVKLSLYFVFLGHLKYFCIPITFNNPLKVCFSNKKYTITTKTRPIQMVKVYFLLENRGLLDF